jgi:predicted GNAT family N-acyltransferase
MSGSHTPDIEVRMASFASESAVLYAIRDEVFVSEQHVPIELEHDEDDLTCTHVLAYVRGIPAGTGRLLDDGRIGRMAVLAKYRGSGVGRAVLDALLRIAAERGLTETYCSAQYTALGFYERAGFKAEGPLYEEAGITHQKMRRRV